MTNREVIVFRADASVQIGTGHVMRCLTLADALRDHGRECHFICREHPGHLIESIRGRGFSVHVLPVFDEENDKGAAAGPAHAGWLGASWETDARQSADVVRRLHPRWVVVDHYALDARWEAVVRPQGGRLMVIDDLADRRHEAELLLDQNLGRASVDYAGLVPNRCRLLIGPRYALLRPEFARLREQSLRRRQSPCLKRLLVTMGGVDKGNATGKVLDALRDCPLPDDIEIEVVMGGNAPWLESVRAQIATMPWPTRMQVDVPDLARRMVEADIAIGAAGSTSWERCCLGLPALVVVLAENQRSIAEALHSAGAAQVIGTPNDLPSLSLRWEDAMRSMPLAKTAAVASNVTEGNGTQLVTRAIEGGGD